MNRIYLNVYATFTCKTVPKVTVKVLPILFLNFHREIPFGDQCDIESVNSFFITGLRSGLF